HQPWLLERKLERDPSPERGADEHDRAQATVFDVALNKTREVRDGVSSTRLFCAAVSRQVGGVNPMPLGGRLERETPLHVARRTEAVDEDHSGAAAAVHVVHAQ